MQKEATELKFLCDFMIQKLGKILILCGFDTLVIKKALKVDEIIYLSRSEKRFIISRNTKIKTENSIILKEQKPYLQLKRLIYELNIKLDKNKFFTRCSFCNTQLEKICKDKVINEIPPLTAQNTEEFYICTNCNKIYWKQTHYELFSQKINDIKS